MRMYLATTIVLFFIWTAMPVWGDDGEERGHQAAPEATDQQVQKWISQLDADAFVVRENAMQRLIQAQIVAIEPIKKALADNSLEVTTRGIHILQELALSDDMAIELAARAALEDVADARVTSAARRAAATLETLNNLRQARSVERLERLGAKFETTPVQAGFQFAETPDKIVIDDEWKGKDEDLRLLEWLHDIRDVDLSGAKVNDGWLSHVARMPNLSKIAVKRAQITDAALTHLQNLENLDALDLFYVPLKDSAAAILLKIKPRVIKLYGTRINEETAAKLRGELATTILDYRRGAFLGVGCQDLPEGCAIGLVHPTSAAKRADLQERDIIAAYNGSPVPNFETLTSLISKHASGDRVTIEVIRDGKHLTKEIVLGEWE